MGVLQDENFYTNFIFLFASNERWASYAMDNVMGTTPLNPGTPILTNGMIYVSNFGAGLTPLEDSSLLVYKVVPNHPLGLAPGDIILGYQGILWHQLVRELLQGGVPHSLWIGGAPSAFNRTLLWAAGESWHLFDTIDVVKYSTWSDCAFSS